MNEQKQDLLAFLRELQFVIEGHSASMWAPGNEYSFWLGNPPFGSRGEVFLNAPLNGECPSLAEAIERLENEIAPQRGTPDEDGTSYL